MNANSSLMTRLASPLLALALSLAAALPAGAETLNIDVQHIASQGLLGDAANTVLSFQLGANAHVDSIAWDLDLNALAPSWLSEMQLALGNSEGSAGLLLTPAWEAQRAGSGHFSGQLDLKSAGLDFSVGADGVLRLEFAELAGDGLRPDGYWQSGSLSLGLSAAVPEPASAALLALGLIGLGGLGFARRRARA